MPVVSHGRPLMNSRRLSNDDTRRVLAEKASHGAMTQRDTARAVNQHRGKSKPKPRSLQKVFLAENGIRVTVSAGSQSFVSRGA